MDSFAHELARRIEARRERLDAWFARSFDRYRAPFTTSVDLRDAGFKLVQVDTNIFPGGFNNLCEGDHARASQTFRQIITERAGGGVQTIGILAESHTSNLPYFFNLRILQKILQEAGFEVEVLSLAEALVRERTLVPLGEESLEVCRAKREGARIGSERLLPDILILNNDLSGGVPKELAGLEQPLLPLPEFGWWNRRKDVHFEHYDRFAREAAEILEIDPWRISAYQETVSGVDFEKGERLESVAEAVDRVRARVQEKYKESGIAEAPYAVVKSNAGTYGMSVLPVGSGAEVLSLNSRDRKKLSRGKGGVVVRDVLIQEGVPTASVREGKACEPVFYLVGGEVVGAFFRIHAAKGARDNLNSPGAEFQQICIYKYAQGRPPPPSGFTLDAALVPAYTFIARLASLAAGAERQPGAAEQTGARAG